MQWYPSAVSRRVSRLTFTICSAIALVVLFAAPQAMSQVVGQTAAEPENIFSRWFRPQTAQPAVTAPAAAQPEPRARKPRISKARKRPKPAPPVAEKSAPAEKEAVAPVQAPAPEQEKIAESGWPIAAATVGTAMITPLTIKTVREQLEPEPETLLVSENELSEIDRAARLAHAEASPQESVATTDGSGAIENDPAEQAHASGMMETIKAMMQAAGLQVAWIEPVLLMIAGALAGLAASRAFV
jgi:hypothetical protein